MDNTSNIYVLNTIKRQFELLEDTFYDGIPNEQLTNFMHMIGEVHSKIVALLKNKNKNRTNDLDINKMRELQNINIDYSQLEALGKKDYS